MGLPVIFIMGHSFIRRLDNFVVANPNLNHQLLLNNVSAFKWHVVEGGGGGGGRTVAKTLQKDLSVVASVPPDSWEPMIFLVLIL